MRNWIIGVLTVLVLLHVLEPGQSNTAVSVPQLAIPWWVLLILPPVVFALLALKKEVSSWISSCFASRSAQASVGSASAGCTGKRAAKTTSGHVS
jgi:hypothetical protein